MMKLYKALILGFHLIEPTIALSRANSTFDVSKFDPSNIITRDVCVVGGGSAGTYAAIRLRQMNQSVIVVEKEGELGGHTNTFIDPSTKTAVDYGVQYFENLNVVTNYFAHFDIPFTTVPATGGEQHRIDFRTGTPAVAPQGNVTEDMLKYAAQLMKYPYLSEGFNLPDDVPADLLLPFGDFADKYNLGSAVDLIATFNQGVGNWLKQLTIYTMKYFSLDVLQGAQDGFLQTTEHNNGALYVAAQKELGKDALVNSAIVSVDRDSDPNWNYVVVRAHSSYQLIRAKKLIVAIPPKLRNFVGFDLDTKERSLFDQFKNTYYYTSLANNTGIPLGTRIINRANDTRYHLPPLPGVYIINPTIVPGLVTILYGSEDRMTEREVKNDITKSVLRLRNAGFNTTEPDFLAFSDHSPFELTVSAHDIDSGFYNKLYDLQGHRDTYYTGATFHTHDSSQIWRFTETLLQENFS